MLAALLFAAALVYLGYFFYAAVRFKVQPLGIRSEERLRVFAESRRTHLVMKKIYTPLCFLFSGYYHFLTEEEFKAIEQYNQLFGGGQSTED